MVGDRRQARLLTDPRSAAFIYPFLGRDRSVGEAAAEVGCPITTMVYRVRILEQAGLLIITDTRRRAGRPVSIYRSSCDSYRVPLATTGFDDHRDQVRRIGAPIYRQLADAYSAVLASTGTATRFITRDDHGHIYSTDLPPHHDRGGYPVTFEDRNLHLTRGQAEQLCRDLDRILEDAQKDDHGPHPKQDYSVMVAAIPAADQPPRTRNMRQRRS